jgi:hypothetical protein
VRPHPFESEEPYRAAFAGMPNVTVDGAGSVLEVIANAEAVVHFNCGTAVEAVMLEKLPLHLQFLDTAATAGHAKLPARVSRAVGSPEELIAILADLPRATSRFDFSDVYARYIHRFFHFNDGKASERVAEVLLREVAASEHPKRSLGAVIASSRPRPSAGQIAKGLASAAFGSAATSGIRMLVDAKRRDKAVTPSAVSSILGAGAGRDRGTRGRLRVTRARTSLLGLPLASLRVNAS